MRRVHYAWVILGLCFFGLLAAQGTRLSFGAFVAPWEADFGVDRATVSFVSFVSFLIYGFTQPVVGRLVDRFGSRSVLSFSVLLVGLSLALAALSSLRCSTGSSPHSGLGARPALLPASP